MPLCEPHPHPTLRLTHTHKLHWPLAGKSAKCNNKCVGFGQVGYHGACCTEPRLCGTGLTCVGGMCVCDESELREGARFTVGCCSSSHVFEWSALPRLFQTSDFHALLH